MRILAAALLSIGPAFAQSDPGPAVGARIPSFALPDQNGEIRSLRSLAGRKGLMLVFYRSADW